ncbi:MAG TPA: hypothetical protein VK540_25920 [Polyangiaceae bacterium]|jgi:hypothetical protein|nr:hypothetical protein [Polyangiaceae bacterium]
MLLDTDCHDRASAKIIRTDMAANGKYLAATSRDGGARSWLEQRAAI